MSYTPLADTVGQWSSSRHHPSTGQAWEFLSDEEYLGLQDKLAEDPERGNLIKRGGDIRKVRHAVQGRRNRGLIKEL